MKQTGKRVSDILGAINAAMLALMAILVFGNVVLRYAFNSGIMWSEEMSRFLFIWLCFIGAIGALKDNEHLGVDALVKRLSIGKKRLLYTLSNLIVLYLLWLVLEGSWKVAVANLETSAPVTGLPMFYIYITGVVMSVLMGCIVIRNLYKAWFVKDSVEELVKIKESEEEILYSEEPKTAQGG